VSPSLRRILREPLLHFAVLGVAIFALWGLVGDDRPPQDVVVVTADRVDALVDGFSREQGRAPTPAERDALVAAEVAEEVLWREALGANLEQGDPIVRRRVVDRMRRLIEQTRDVARPTEAELAAFAQERGASADRLALRQVFFDATRRSDPEAAARAALAVVRAGQEPPAGDHFALGASLGPASVAQHRIELGAPIADAVAELPEGAWTVAGSAWGWHLVHVERREPAATEGPARDQLVAAWQGRRRQEAADVAIDRLVTLYEVRVAP
jgi:peptidyl-prolyl cis-trans isomerase C